MPPPSSQVVTAYVRHLLRTHLLEHPEHGAMSELAREIGVKPAPLTMIRDGLRNVGRDYEEAIARKFAEGSVDKLRRDAAEWWRDQPESKEREVVYEERYPNRAAAVRAARELGLTERAIQIVLGYSLASQNDPNPREWLRWIEEEEGRLQREAMGVIDRRVPVQPGEVGGAPVIPKGPKRG
jgi:hypothetical protein